MIKTLAAQIRQYKKASILAPIFTFLETVMEILIPLVMASIIDNGIEKNDMSVVLRDGLLMICMAAVCLLFGILAGRFAAYASTGFACNVRDAMYEKIQTFSFSNIDRKSVV